MTYSELKDLSPETLHTKIEAEQTQLRKYRFSHTLSPLEKTHQIKATKQHIARLYTALHTPKTA